MNDSINVLCVMRTTPAQRARIEAIDPRLHVIDAGGWFDGEVRDTWPQETIKLYIAPDAVGQGTPADRDALIATADIALVSFPFPIDMRARGPCLKWVHQRPAGASNQKAGDLWDSDVVVTTSRGYAASIPIAEFAVAGFYHFARGLHRAAEDRVNQFFNKAAYQPVQMTGKTACIVGTGGIGREVGRLCAAVGMHVVGTRRGAIGDLPPGFDDIRNPDGLHDLLSISDFVAICCQWTPETDGLFGPELFAAMKPGTVLANVARGEIIDEEALIAALAADRLRGVVLDVYVGEFNSPPDPRLWQDPRVLIAPHISGHTDLEIGGSQFMDVFCRNIESWLLGLPLENVIDWDRGY